MCDLFYAITRRSGEQEIILWFEQRLEQRKMVKMIVVWFPVQRSTDVKRSLSCRHFVGVRRSIEYVTNHRSSSCRDSELLEWCTVKQNDTDG